MFPTAGKEPEVSKVSSADEILELRKVALSVPVPQRAKRYAIHLVVGAQPGSEYAPKVVNEFVALGPSPRAVQALMLCSKVRALTGWVPNPDLSRTVGDILDYWQLWL